MAIRVPQMSPDIPAAATPEVPTYQPRPVPEGAFGGDVAQAGERQGQAVQQTGEEVFQRMMEHRDREIQQQNFDKQTQMQNQIQDVLKNPALGDDNVPKGILLRQMNQAKGATAAYDQQANGIYKQAMEDPTLSPIQRQELHKSLSTMLMTGREQVVNHEAQQSQAAFDNSFQTNMKTTVANAAGIADPDMLKKYLNVAQMAAEPGWKHSGLGDDQIPAAKQGLASEIAKSAITPLLESDPKKAQTLFDSVKDQMTPLAAAEMQNQIIGKKVDQTVLDTFDWADKNARRGPDNTIDRAAVDAHVKAMNLPPNEELTVMTHVDRRAMVDASEQFKNKQEKEKGFVDQVTVGQSTGKMAYDDALRLAVSTGGSPSDIADREAKVTALYSNKASSFNTWLGQQPQETRGAVEDAKLAVQSAYPKKKDIQQGAMTELEQQWLGKSPGQIRQITADKLKQVVTEHHDWWFDKTQTGWQVDASNRASEQMMMAKIQSDQPAAFAAARAKVQSDGAPLVYDNIKAVMQKMSEQSQ